MNKRLEHLKSLAEDYDLTLDFVMQCANMLGESEDHDGLPSMLEEAKEMGL